MARTKASRKFQLTINHPQTHGLDHTAIKGILQDISGCSYWCMCDEIGEQGTYHTHLYLVFQHAKEFHMIHQRFYGAHIETAYGTHQENRDYIRKEGRWADSEKSETNLPDTFEESGELPQEPDRRMKQSEQILQLVISGASNAEIILAHPSAMHHLPRIDQARQTLLAEEYRTKRRVLTVTYLWGAPGVGKTRGILDHHGYESVYRVTNYSHPFDSYAGQPVMMFDEFRSSLPLADMLNYLDEYPLQLPCRYTDRTACYTVVYLVSNIPLEKQYQMEQMTAPETWKAFQRRITNVWELSKESGGLPF